MRDNSWKEDDSLKSDLTSLVEKRLRRSEILDYMRRDYGNYAWSTLDRRLNFFSIKYIDYRTPMTEVRACVECELQGPGQKLGYRALAQKLRQTQNLKVPRDLVYDMMYDINPDALAERNPKIKAKAPRGHFVTKGANWFHSFDGHDKLMGYQNHTFPLAIYGCLDTASRKILWLKVWTSNSDPRIIGNWYLQYLYETRKIASNIRMDRGTETGDLAAIHAYLRSKTGCDDPCNAVVYGPSTSNQVSTLLYACVACYVISKYFKTPHI